MKAHAAAKPTAVVETPFAKLLKYHLESNAWKPADLAHRVGVDRSTVSRWLTGKKKPGANNIGALARALGVEERIVVETLVSENYWIRSPANIDPDIRRFMSDFKDLPVDYQHVVKAILHPIYHLGLRRANPNHPSLKLYKASS